MIGDHHVCFGKSLPNWSICASTSSSTSIEGYGNCESLKFQCCNALLNLTATPAGLVISAWMIILLGEKLLSSTFLHQSIIQLKFCYSTDCIPEVWLALIYSWWWPLPCENTAKCTPFRKRTFFKPQRDSRSLFLKLELVQRSRQNCFWDRNGQRRYVDICWWKKSCTTWDA